MKSPRSEKTLFFVNFCNKGIMQIFKQVFSKNTSLTISSPGLCGHVGCLGMAVEPEKWTKIEF